MKKPTQKAYQKCPLSIKVGTVLYRVFSWVNKSGKAKTEMEEWIVRSVQRRRGSQSKRGRKSVNHDASYNEIVYVHLTQKIQGVTWGKLSKKQFHYGWLASISRLYKEKCTLGEDLPWGMYTTKLAACIYASKDAELDLYNCLHVIENETMNEVVMAEYIVELEEKKLTAKATSTYLKRFRTNMAKKAKASA